MYSSGHMDTQHPRCVCTSTHPSQASAHTSSQGSLLCRVVLSLLPSTPTICQDKIWQLRQPQKVERMLSLAQPPAGSGLQPRGLGSGSRGWQREERPGTCRGWACGRRRCWSPTLGGLPPHLSLGHRLEPVTSKLLQGLPNPWSPSVYSWALAAQTKGG